MSCVNDPGSVYRVSRVLAETCSGNFELVLNENFENNHQGMQYSSGVTPLNYANRNYPRQDGGMELTPETGSL